MRTALDVHHLLLGRGVPHEVVRLRAPVLGCDDLPAALGVEHEACVAVRCYAVTGARAPDGAAVHLAAVLVHAGGMPGPAALLEALGATSARAASPAEVNAHTGCAAGLVCPLGLPEDVLVLADSALGARPTLHTASGEGGVALRLATRDLLVASGARVATLTVRALSHEERGGWGRPLGTAAVVDLRERRSGARRPAG